MRQKLNITEDIFPMPILMGATYYRVAERVGAAFKDGLSLRK